MNLSISKEIQFLSISALKIEIVFAFSVLHFKLNCSAQLIQSGCLCPKKNNVSKFSNFEKFQLKWPLRIPGVSFGSPKYPLVQWKSMFWGGIFLRCTADVVDHIFWTPMPYLDMSRTQWHARLSIHPRLATLVTPTEANRWQLGELRVGNFVKIRLMLFY